MQVALGMQSPQCREKQQHQDPGEYSGTARALALGAGMSAPGGVWPTAVVAAGRALVQKQDLLSHGTAARVGMQLIGQHVARHRSSQWIEECLDMDEGSRATAFGLDKTVAFFVMPAG